MKMPNRSPIVFCLILSCFLFSSSASAQTSLEHREDLFEADAPIWGENDTVLRGVFNDHDAYFLIPEFAKVEEAALQIDLSHAKELLPDLSSLTVYLNGKPLQNFFLTPANSDHARISVPLDPEDLVTGTNAIRLTFFMRSLLIPCADMDNPINWSILHKDSFVRAKFRIARQLSVGDIGDIFCKAGPLFSDRTAFLLDENADEEILQAAATLANYFGSVSGKGRDLKVFFKGNVSPEALSGYNIVALGRPEHFPASVALDQWMSRSGLRSFSDLKAREALVFVGGSPWAKDKFILGISSLKGEDVRKAAWYITNYDLSELENDSMVLGELTLKDLELKLRKRPPSEGSFKSLGYPDAVVSGVFVRKSSVSFRRPTNWKLYGGSFKFAIQYSSFLIPETSGVTVEINGTPVASAKFVGNPDRPIMLTADIPQQMLNDKFYLVSSNFFLDIGQKDCNHQFKDKAWAVIKNNTRFSMIHGFRNIKDFSDFPSILMRGDRLQPTVMIVPADADEGTLSLAMTIFANIGAMVAHDPAIPLIQRAGNEVPKSFKKSNIVMLGRPNEFRWYKDVSPNLPLGYDARTDIFKVDASLPNISFEDSYAVMQTGFSPWNASRAVMLFSAGGKGNEFLRKILTDPDSFGRLHGDFVYASSGDRVASFNVKLRPKKAPSESKLMIIWLMSVAVFSLLVMGVYFFAKRKNREG